MTVTVETPTNVQDYDYFNNIAQGIVYLPVGTDQDLRAMSALIKLRIQPLKTKLD